MKVGTGFLGVGLLVASTGLAQDAYSVAPQAYRKQIENDLVLHSADGVWSAGEYLLIQFKSVDRERRP